MAAARVLAALDDKVRDGILTAVPDRLPLTERLERAFVSRAHGLPPVTRALLLLAAADDRGALGEVIAAGAITTGTAAAVSALAPAVEARLISLDGHTVLFCHPLARSGFYQRPGNHRTAISRPLSRLRGNYGHASSGS